MHTQEFVQGYKGKRLYIVACGAGIGLCKLQQIKSERSCKNVYESIFL